MKYKKTYAKFTYALNLRNSFFNFIYFFNPFSVEILRKVMARILESYYAEPRRIQLFFYYPSDEYISYLMTVEELMFIDEIVCMDLFPGEDPREKIAIFELDYME